MQTDCDNRAGAFRDNCRALVADICAALGEDFFTKGQDVSFIELVPDGWDGEPTAALLYDGVTYFRDLGAQAVVASKRSGAGASYCVLHPGMTEADFPWNETFAASIFSAN